MVLRIVFISWLCLNLPVLNVIANYNYERTTLYGNSDPSPARTKSLLLQADDEGDGITGSKARYRREITQPQSESNFTKVSFDFQFNSFALLS